MLAVIVTLAMMIRICYSRQWTIENIPNTPLNHAFRDIQQQSLDTIKLYPFCLLFCYVSGIIRRLMEFDHDYDPPLWIVYWHVGSSSLWGFFNSLIYYYSCYRYPVKRNNKNNNNRQNRRNPRHNGYKYKVASVSDSDNKYNDNDNDHHVNHTLSALPEDSTTDAQFQVECT